MTAPNIRKGYDEDGRWHPMLAMQALSDIHKETSDLLRKEIAELQKENEKLFTQLCDALEQMSEMAIDLKYEMALSDEV